jgi:hypothetical protein
MKNEITHPLERYKLIADPTIRQQCIDNFSQEYWDKWAIDDDNSIDNAIFHMNNWETTPQGRKYWQYVWEKAIDRKLPLLPEPIEEQSEIDQLRSENEKLRECLSDCLQMLEQTKTHRQILNINGGDVFLNSTIDKAQQLLNK